MYARGLTLELGEREALLLALPAHLLARGALKLGGFGLDHGTQLGVDVKHAARKPLLWRPRLVLRQQRLKILLNPVRSACLTLCMSQRQRTARPAGSPYGHIKVAWTGGPPGEQLPHAKFLLLRRRLQRVLFELLLRLLDRVSRRICHVLHFRRHVRRHAG